MASHSFALKGCVWEQRLPCLAQEEELVEARTAESAAVGQFDAFLSSNIFAPMVFQRFVMKSSIVRIPSDRCAARICLTRATEGASACE
eukprot:5735420-Prymnesium_polylepis.1